MSQLAPPRPSASVILLKKLEAPNEPFAVYLLKRNEKSKFMPGRFVFPGGALEPSDGRPEKGGLKRCALRELWEEAGVILADDPAAVAALPAAGRDEARQALLSGQSGLTEALAGLGLSPDLGALIPFARWITPLARPKRFDTTFYLARMPRGQTATSDDAETSQGVWLTPHRALEENQTAGVGLAPPQVRLLGELAEAESLEALLNRPANLEPVQPILWSDGSRRVILLPWDGDYAAGAPQNEARPCPAGQASRLVHLDGRWLPFRLD